jgi:signal transduction histidine kinase
LRRVRPLDRSNPRILSAPPRRGVTASPPGCRKACGRAVADTERGIPPEKLEPIFEPFVQLSAGLTDRQGGVGLGLAISRDLARGMDGDLTVQSTVGVGSRFTLTLPRAGSASRGE